MAQLLKTLVAEYDDLNPMHIQGPTKRKAIYSRGGKGTTTHILLPSLHTRMWQVSYPPQPCHFHLLLVTVRNG